MEIQIIIAIVTGLFGTGGVVAWINAASTARNNNKRTDIKALELALKTIQDRYQELVSDNSANFRRTQERLQFLEIEYVKQSQQNNESLKRIAELEIDLKKANDKISALELELNKKNLDIMKLEQENIELRKQNNRIGLMV